MTFLAISFGLSLNGRVDSVRNAWIGLLRVLRNERFPRTLAAWLVVVAIATIAAGAGVVRCMQGSGADNGEKTETVTVGENVGDIGKRIEAENYVEEGNVQNIEIENFNINLSGQTAIATPTIQTPDPVGTKVPDPEVTTATEVDNSSSRKLTEMTRSERTDHFARIDYGLIHGDDIDLASLTDTAVEVDDFDSAIKTSSKISQEPLRSEKICFVALSAAESGDDQRAHTAKDDLPDGPFKDRVHQAIHDIAAGKAIDPSTCEDILEDSQAR